MTREETVEIIKHKKDDFERFGGDKEIIESLEKGIKALELIGYLKDRPCDACTFHTENGCSKWNCVFNGVLGIKDI